MRRLAAAVVVAGLALLGCGDDSDDGEGGSDPATTTDPLEEVGDCAETAEAVAPDEARTGFPDNPDVTWTVLGSRAGGLGMVLVEVEPDTDEVGYPSFTLVFGCGTGEPVKLATYALDGDEYVLLSTTDAAEDGEFAPTLDE